jgi:hypothetical protein
MRRLNSRTSRTVFKQKGGVLGARTAVLGPRNEQKQGSAVTEKSPGKNYKRLIVSELQADLGSKDGLRRGRGGAGWYRPGTYLTDGTVVSGQWSVKGKALLPQSFSLCAGGRKLSARRGRCRAAGEVAGEEGGVRRFSPTSRRRVWAPGTRPPHRLHFVMQMNYNRAKEFFSCRQTRWCKHGSILP